jgi:hypothetical protein
VKAPGKKTRAHETISSPPSIETTKGRWVVKVERLVGLKKSLSNVVAKGSAIYPLLFVVALPLVARSGRVARIPALEPLGKEVGRQAAAAIFGGERGLP